MIIQCNVTLAQETLISTVNAGQRVSLYTGEEGGVS